MFNLTKIQNKFIIIILILIIYIISFQAIKSNKIDRNSYVNLISWEASIISLENKQISLNIQDRKALSIWDTIKTTSDETLAIIEWWDGSITRMWWKSELKIKSNLVSDDKTNIQISFELIKWKTWSNVISFMWNGSYFKASYADKEAAVRWTIFELNADKQYLYVDKHEVQMTNKSGEKLIIWEQTALDLNTFSIITLIDFLKKYQDEAWLKINESLDNEFIKNLKAKLDEIVILKDNLKNIISNSDFKNIDLSEKQELYNKLLEQYQNLDFISPEDNDLYKQKLEYKKYLSILAPEEDKQALTIKTLYDLSDFKWNYDLESLKDTVSILSINKDSLSSLNIDFNEILEKVYFPEEIKKQLNIIYENEVFDIISSETQKVKWFFSSFMYFLKNLF